MSENDTRETALPGKHETSFTPVHTCHSYSERVFACILVHSLVFTRIHSDTAKAFLGHCSGSGLAQLSHVVDIAD